MQSVALSIAAHKALRSFGKNSSHPLWEYAPLQFFETKNGWVIAYRMAFDVAVIALEPLPLDGHAKSFPEAWKEFVASARPTISAFITVGQDFASHLENMGFETMVVAREPWITLQDWSPSGNRAKGVRAARNQAIRAGVDIEEWNIDDLATDPRKRLTLMQILSQWQKKFLIRLTGFLNFTDPLHAIVGRRWFVARVDHHTVGYLIATPIAQSDRYFLEDLILSKNAPRGTGELLTCAALESLKRSGVNEVSLGIVSKAEPSRSKSFFRALAFFFEPLFQPNGVYLFRKRFRPDRWEPMYICVKTYDHTKTGVFTWIRSLAALLSVLDPKLNRTLSPWVRPIGRFVTQHGFSLFFLVTSTIAFENSVGQTRSEFFALIAGLLLTIPWAERTYGKRFLAAFFICAFGVVGLLSRWLGHPALFFHSDALAPVLMATAGALLTRLKRKRESVLPAALIFVVSLLALMSDDLKMLTSHLLMIMMFCLGMIVGKSELEFVRSRSRKMSKKKPLAKNVARGLSL